MLFALVFAQYLSPIGGLGGVIVGVYLGAIPASAAFFASLSEFDLWGLIARGRPLASGRRAATCRAPATRRRGYLLLIDDGRRAVSGRPRRRPELDVGALWD